MIPLTVSTTNFMNNIFIFAATPPRRHAATPPRRHA
jgi:hypothetical protein